MHDISARTGHHATAAAVHRRIDDPLSTEPCVDIVIPVFNEASVVDASIARLHAYLSEGYPFTWRVATGSSVMAIGGFNGTGGAGGPGGGQTSATATATATSTSITSWVATHFIATTVGGVTVYDLTAASGS